MALLALNACAAEPVLGAVENLETQAETAVWGEDWQTQEVQPTESALLPTQTPTEALLPENLASITADNADAVRQLAVIQPDFPKYELISPDGRIGARADLAGIDIYEMDGGKLVTRIDAALPDCQFGWDRYFSFNHDGSFLAVAGRQAIQVWQVGGGIIYESPISNPYGTDAETCGAEVPQLALSPDASLLAVSGVAISSTSAQAYFRVIATLKNQVLYEWNGDQDSLHGDLYTFRGLGFSTDGTVLQTFNASRFNAFFRRGISSLSFLVGGWLAGITPR